MGHWPVTDGALYRGVRAVLVVTSRLLKGFLDNYKTGDEFAVYGNHLLKVTRAPNPR